MDDLARLTRRELDQLAAERGVDGYPKHGSKADKVAALQGADTSPANVYRHYWNGRTVRAEPGSNVDVIHARDPQWRKVAS